METRSKKNIQKKIEGKGNHHSEIAGIILAAGESNRMGHPKQLLTAGGETLLCRVLRVALYSKLDPVVLVVGFQAAKIIESLGNLKDHTKLRIVENLRFHEGMSTSLIAGLSSVEHTRDRIMVLLGDMPRVTSELIDRLRKKALESEYPLCAAMVQGRRSLPVVIGRELYREVKELKGDVGARGIFLNHPDQICHVEPPFQYDDSDIDTPEEFNRFKEAIKKHPS